MTNNNTIGALIRSLRKKRKLSLRELGKMVGMSHVNIAHIENNRVTTNSKTLIALAIALEYDEDKLLAMANEIGDDIKQIIKSKPNAVPQFLRTAKNLSDENWEELSKLAEKMEKNKQSENVKK